MRTNLRGLPVALIALGLMALAAAILPGVAAADYQHTVIPGESLASVAAADGLTVAQLAAANGLAPDSQLVAGARLAIPPQGGAGPLAPAAAPATSGTVTGDADGDGDLDPTGATAGAAPAAVPTAPAPGGGYVVQPGDTLSALAARAGLTVDQLAAANGLSATGLLVSGTTISLGGGAPGAGSSPVSPAAAAPTAAPALAPSAPQATGQYVTPGTVGSIAASEGVPASLAEAIAFQESGFNNNAVSSSGATGVMQIEPGTWNYIGANLAGPPPLSPASASDNIRAGTLLLHSLLAQTQGNQALAAAAYYQGLQSVQTHGVYADTQRYVNDVMALQSRFGGP
jgi:LysM repeat protein